MSRSSPDTPLSDRLGSAHAGRASSRGLGSRAGSWTSPPRDSPDAARAGAAHAGEALSCTASLSGSISERSINLCFAGRHSGSLTHADGGTMAAAADKLQPAQEGSADRTAGTAGPSVVLGDHRSESLRLIMQALKGLCDPREYQLLLRRLSVSCILLRVYFWPALVGNCIRCSEAGIL